LHRRLIALSDTLNISATLVKGSTMTKPKENDVVEITTEEELLAIFGQPRRRDPYGFLIAKEYLILINGNAPRDEEI
jgi:hypothetical protein